MVGKAGVEETYDELLRGQDGSRDVIVDSHGREVGYLGIQHAIPGQDLKLTIDNDLQRAAELALGNRNGAIVAMDPRNGEILAMVSRPSFDPNDFAVRINRTDWNKLITDPDHPLMNKAIQAQLAPGSTFKILMSVAGLQEGIAQNLKVNCNGGWGPYGYFHHCDGTTAPSTSTTPSPTPATPSTTCSATSWASTASPNTPLNSATARRPASTCPASRPASCPRPSGR